MNWIKEKYDRVLLGVCGLIAFIIGAILLMGAVGFKKKVAVSQSGEVSGAEVKGASKESDKVDEALKRLKEVVKVDAPKHNNVSISLFTSAPVVKMVDKPDPINVRDPNSVPIRPPVSNVWLYDNNLDLLRVDVLKLDDDGDNFNTEEEWLGDKTNPRDATSHPPVYVKIQYRDLIQEPLTVKFNTYVSDTDLTFRIIGATPESAWNTRDLKVGGTFPVEKGGTEPRFKLTKVDATVEARITAFVEDLKSGKKDIEFRLREDVKFPTNRARLVCTLGKEEEKIVAKGDEFYFEVDRDQSYTVKDVTETEVILEFTPKGATEKKTITIKMPPPP